MKTITLGDRVEIPSKNVKGEVAYIGKTHFANGTWFGIILDDPIGKHNGTVENECYFKCATNHGMFIKTSYFDRECVDINNAEDNHCDLLPKRIEYPNYLKTGSKQKKETSTSNRKMKPQSQNKYYDILNGDSISNTKDKKRKSTKITKCGDDSASDEKKILFVKRYPNYLKASSKLTGSHFSLNKGNDYKTYHTIGVGNQVARNTDKNLADRNGSLDKDENESPKKIIYPNYLKASSKLARKHLCCAKNNDISNAGIKDASEKTKMQISNEYEDSIDTFDIPYYLIKYPYNQKTFCNLKSKPSCAERRTKMSKTEPLSKKEDNEIPKSEPIRANLGENAEIEEIKCENENLKRKLKSTEVSLQEALNKYNEAQEEIKHLKFDNECQRKQIKFQKTHLKLLQMIRGNLGTRNKTTKQKNIGENLKSALYVYGNNDTNNRKFDLESMKATQRVHELEEQTSMMVQGLIELRNFLKSQCESQTTALKTLNFDNHGRSAYKNIRRRTFSESFGSPPALNPNICTTEKSEAQLKEHSEMLREMTEFNELLKERRENVENWEGINLASEFLGDGNFLSKSELDNCSHLLLQSTQNSPNGSKFDINTENYVDSTILEMDTGAFQNSSPFKKNNIQNNYQIAMARNSLPITTERKVKTNKYNVEGDEAPLESVEGANKLNHQMSTEDLVYDEDASFSSATLIEEDVFGEDGEYFEFVEHSTSKKSEVYPGFPINLSGDSPMVLPQSKRSDKKVPVSTGL